MEFRLSVGIDLGTSNTCIYYQTLQNNCEPLHINPQSPVIPSIVSYDEINTVVGDAAKSQLKRRLRNREGQNHTIIKNAKRVLGIWYQEELSAIKNSLCFARAVKGDDGFVEFATAKGKRITPVDVYTDILKYLNREVSRRGARPVDSLVVTVPARFNYRQLFLTYDAIKRAFGKETKVLLIDEPTAAAVASNILLLEKDMTFIVYDLGGGTFDLSVLRYSNNTVECLATSGDDSIGGVRFDEVLMEYVTSREEWITFTKDLSEREINKYKKSLLEQCIDVKENLSTANSDDIIIADGKFSISIQRAVFERQIRKLVQQTINIMNETIIRAGLSKDQINQVILVGGSTKIPLIEEELTKNFDNRSVVMYNVNPWSCVAQGACMISRGWEKSNFNEFEISINGKAFTINQDLEGILYIGQPFNATDMRPESIRMTSPTGMVDMRPESIRMTSSTALVDTRPESIRMTSPTALVDMRPESVRLPLRNLSLEDKPMSIRFTETTIEQLKRRIIPESSPLPKPSLISESSPLPKPTPISESSPLPKPTPISESSPLPKPSLISESSPLPKPFPLPEIQPILFKCEGNELNKYIESFEVGASPVTRGYKNNNKFMCIRLRYEFEGKQKVLQKIIRKSKRNEIIIVTFSRIVENGKDLLKIVATNQQHIELENHVFSLFRFC